MLLLLFTRGLKVGRAKPCKASQRPSVRLDDPHPAAASKSKRDTKLACLQNKQPKSAPGRQGLKGGGFWRPWSLGSLRPLGSLGPRVPTFPRVPPKVSRVLESLNLHTCASDVSPRPQSALVPVNARQVQGPWGPLGNLGTLETFRDPSNPANPTLGTLGTPRTSGTQRPRDFKRSLVAPRILGLEGILARTSRRVPFSLGILQHHRVMQKHKMPKPRHTHTHIANGPQHHNIISQLQTRKHHVETYQHKGTKT